MKLLRLLLPVVLALAPAMVKAQTLGKVKETGTLTIAFDPNVPPWSYKDADLNYTGFEWMVASKFGADNGLKLNVVETNGANRIPLLLTGQVDVVWATMAVTDERKEVIDFSVPYAGTQIAISGPPQIKIETAEDLVGHSVAVARGTIIDSKLSNTVLPGTEIVRFEDEATALTSILSGQVQFLAVSTSLNPVIAKRDPSKVVEPKIILGSSLFAVGLRKDETALKALLDGWIAENIKNGEIPRIYNEVHGTPMPSFVKEAVLSPAG